jgi:hypothetical protein
MTVESFSVPQRNADSRPISQAETLDRFCGTCVFFHETRAMFLPGEASDFIAPNCYYDGSLMVSGWCAGAAYHEDIP